MAVDPPRHVLAVRGPDANQVHLDAKEPVLVHLVRLVCRVATHRVPPLFWEQDRRLVDRLGVAPVGPPLGFQNAIYRELVTLVAFSVPQFDLCITVSIHQAFRVL